MLKLNFRVKSVVCFCLDPQWHCVHVVSILGLTVEDDSAVVEKYFPHKVNGKDLRPVLWVKQAEIQGRMN